MSVCEGEKRKGGRAGRRRESTHKHVGRVVDEMIWMGGQRISSQKGQIANVSDFFLEDSPSCHYLSPSSVKAATGNMKMNVCSCVLIKLYGC